MAKFVFIYKGGAPKDGEMEQNVKDWGEWIKDLTEKGIYKSGDPFGFTRKVVNEDQSVSDGTSDNAGFSVIEAGSIDEAVEIAKTGPTQKYGGSTEVYDTLDMSEMM